MAVRLTKLLYKAHLMQVPWSPLALSSRTRAIFALLVANVIWGTTFVVTKPVLDRVPPITLAGSRFAIAVLILLALLFQARRRPILNRTTALLGFVGIFVAYVCQNLGLLYTDATNAAIIHGGVPALTAMIAVPALGEYVCGRQLIGFILSLIGVLTVVLVGSVESLGLSLIGDGLVLVSALGLAVYLVLGRRAFTKEDPLELVGGAVCFGLVFLLPMSAIEISVKGIVRPSAGDLLILAYLGAGASALAFALWAYGLRHLEAGHAASFSNLKVIVGAVAAAFALNESLSLLQACGGLCILGGVWIATRSTMESTSIATTSRHLSETTSAPRGRTGGGCRYRENFQIALGKVARLFAHGTVEADSPRFYSSPK
jgi:drug/metabolite transporter (DMT)-like permease